MGLNGLPADAPEPLPIESALTDPKVREAFRRADVILGHDRSQVPGHTEVMFGRATLERVAKLGKREKVKVLRFTYDQRTDSLEYFSAACLVLKGSCEYRDGAAYRNLDEQRRQFEESWNADALDDDPT